MHTGAAVRVTPSCRAARLAGRTAHVVSFGRQVEIKLDDGQIAKVNRNELELLADNNDSDDGANKVAAQAIMQAGSIDPDRLEALVNEEDAAIVASLRRRTNDGRTSGGRTPPASPSSRSEPFDMEKVLSKELAQQDRDAVRAEVADAPEAPSPKLRGSPKRGGKDLAQDQDAADEAEATDWKDAEVEHAKNVELVARWVQARRSREYVTADRIRAELRSKGVEPEALEAEALAQLREEAGATEEEEVVAAEEEEEDAEGQRARHLELAAQWLSAKRAKDYRTADRIRATLRAKGVEPEHLARELGAAQGRQPRAAAGPSGRRGRARAAPSPADKEDDDGGAADAADEEWRAAEEHEANVALAAQWAAARRERDYDTADAIRRRLRDKGVEPEELAHEAEWLTSEALRASNMQLAQHWLQAKRDRDYETADRIRAELRAKGLDPSDLAQVAEEASQPPHNNGAADGRGPDGAHEPLGAPARPKKEAAGASSLGQLLVFDYTTIEELPADLEMTVISQKYAATADVLYNVKADAEEKHKAKTAGQSAFDLKQTRAGDFPALPGGGFGGKQAAPKPTKEWGSHLARKPAQGATSSTGAAAANGGLDLAEIAAERELAEAAANPAKALVEAEEAQLKVDAAMARAKAAKGPMDKRAAQDHELNLKLVAKWVQARRDRDYITADEIRKQLRAKRIEPEELALELGHELGRAR